MPLPSMNVTFSKLAATASRRSGQGVVAIIVQDSVDSGLYVFRDADDVISTLSATNQAYIKSAFEGYVNRPAKVLVYVLPTDAANFEAAFTALATQQFDWMVCPPDCSAENATAAAAWISAQRENNKAKYKAVLPNTGANDPAIVNFTTDGIKVGETTYTAAGYCARIAGLIAGTPLSMSTTYAPLTEVEDVTRLSMADKNAAVDAGKFILVYDGEKVKVGRGVTSLTTVTEENPEDLKKIKIVEAIDLIRYDLRLLCEDNYIGRYANSYDNKCLLLTAVKEYLVGLETDGILEAGESVAEIDIVAQRRYLKGKGVDVSSMTDTEVKEANTDTHVFIRAKIRILDAIEDITIHVNY